ncbi:YIP1 family protein [Staphylococcus sp. 17KM0847]|uniref:YIP1 family protein n=1 Tax=Staphylococcus sp. 17KM0847 TaxID=2583989 RepID=UPI0015DC4FE9|nr:YIP1 family protein [Staphylococcus sp. 17KM0847]QLK86822.1 hypothetical protein FGL66_09000 [Staphylococcus sp. 17KM0847]
MTFSKPLHIKSFEQQRYEPKILIKLLLFFVLSITTVCITAFSMDYGALLSEETDIALSGVDMEQIETVSRYGAIIFGTLSVWFILLIVVLALFIIGKIFKLKVRVKSIFAAALLSFIVSYAFQLVALIIQRIMGINIMETDITSLNIFDPGNQALGTISLTAFLSAWLFGIILHSTMHLNKRWSWIFVGIYILLFVILPVIFLSL